MSDKYFDPTSPVNIKVRNLPHWTQEGKIYFVTFRLGDSLPQSKLEQLRAEKDKWMSEHPQPLTQELQLEYHKLFSQRIDKWLDANYGSCILRNSNVVDIVERAILFYDGTRCSVHGYVVMSNHVHLMIEPYEGKKLSVIMHSIKSFVAHEINKITGHNGKVWAEESYDRIIRDAQHYENVKNYIGKNIRQGGITWRI
ncbi:MAG: transposase [Muribaculum sp.]|nr:transposase [Muribaculum sp.]